MRETSNIYSNWACLSDRSAAGLEIAWTPFSRTKCSFFGTNNLNHFDEKNIFNHSKLIVRDKKTMTGSGNGILEDVKVNPQFFFALERLNPRSAK